jgi:uncharacterized protein YpmS
MREYYSEDDLRQQAVLPKKSVSEVWMWAFIVVCILLGLLILLSIFLGVKFYELRDELKEKTTRLAKFQGGVTSYDVDTAKECKKYLEDFRGKTKPFEKFRCCEPCEFDPCDMGRSCPQMPPSRRL